MSHHGMPPPPGFAPPSVVIIQTGSLGPDPATITCPHCRATIATRVEKRATCKTHLFALCLFFFLCWPCIFVPYCCMDSCLVKKHYCPACNAYLGKYSN